MMIKAKYINISFVLMFMPFLLAGSAFAIMSEAEQMKKVEANEKKLGAEVITKPEVKYEAKGLRDPFKTPFEKNFGAESAQEPPPEAADTVLSQLKVQGVIWGGSFAQAIINDKVLKVGDSIEGALIIDISKAGIVFFYGGRKYTISSPISGAGIQSTSGGGQ